MNEFDKFEEELIKMYRQLIDINNELRNLENLEEDNIYRIEETKRIFLIVFILAVILFILLSVSFVYLFFAVS